MTKPPTKAPVITLAPAKLAQLQRTGKLTGRPLQHNAGIESRYVAVLVKLVNQMTAQVERAVLPILREADKEQATTDGFTLDAISDEKKAANKKAAKKAAAAVEKLQATFASMFKNRAHKIADGMFQAVTAESGTALNSTLSEIAGKITLGMGFMDGPVGDVVRGGIAENIALIKSIPESYMGRVSEHLEAAATSGGNMTGLIGKIQAAAGIEKRRAKNIALDQTRKAYNTINGARMAAAGVTKFEWVHSGGGQRPRHKHIERWPAGLNGGIFELANPPNAAEDGDPPYHALPGQMINCKCTMAPVIEMEGAGEEADYTDAPIDFTGKQPKTKQSPPDYAQPATAQAVPLSAAIVQAPAVAPSAILAQGPAVSQQAISPAEYMAIQKQKKADKAAAKMDAYMQKSLQQSAAHVAKLNAEKVAAQVTKQQAKVAGAEMEKAKIEAQQIAAPKPGEAPPTLAAPTAAETFQAKYEAQQAAIKEKAEKMGELEAPKAAPFVPASEIQARQETPRQPPPRQPKPRGKGIPPPPPRPGFTDDEHAARVEAIIKNDNAYHSYGVKNSLLKVEGWQQTNPQKYEAVLDMAKPGAKLTNADLAVVADYTGGGYDVNKIYYDPRFMNPTNPAHAKVAKEYKEYSEALEHSLDKMTKYRSKDPLYRGEDYAHDPAVKAQRMAEMLEAHKADRPVQFGTFLSTSRQSAEAFSGDLRMIVTAKGKNGVHVPGISWNADEDEVLFNRNSRFKVQRIAKDKEGNDVVWLVEV